MNYLALIKRYWQLHEESAFVPMDSHVYGCLLSIFNDKGTGSDWPETLNLTDRTLCTRADVNIKTIDSARTRLIERGLIEVEMLGKGSRSGAIYKLIDTYSTSPITYPKKGYVNGEVGQTYPKNGEVNGEVEAEPIRQLIQEPIQKTDKSLIYIDTKHQTPNLEVKVLPLISFGAQTTDQKTGTSTIQVPVAQTQDLPSTPEVPPAPPAPGTDDSPKKAKSKDHLFRDSPYYDRQAFIDQLAESEYNIYDLAFYHESLKNWADSGSSAKFKKTDWIATARGFMLRDGKDGKAKLAKNLQPINGSSYATANNRPNNNRPARQTDAEFASSIDALADWKYRRNGNSH